MTVFYSNSWRGNTAYANVMYGYAVLLSVRVRGALFCSMLTILLLIITG